MPPHTRTVSQEFRTLSTLFRGLAETFSRLAPMTANGASVNEKLESRGQKPLRRKPQLTAERRRALKLHGQYLGSIRGLKPRQRAQVKKIRAAKGARVGIAAARRMTN
jgi:hypothetical protein